MTDQEIGKKRANNNFLKKQNKPDNYLKGIIKNCTDTLNFRKTQSFADNVKWTMRAFSLDKEAAIKQRKSFDSETNAYNKEMIKLAKNELSKREKK